MLLYELSCSQCGGVSVPDRFRSFLGFSVFALLLLYELLDLNGHKTVWNNKPETDGLGTALKSWMKAPDEPDKFVTTAIGAFFCEGREEQKRKKKRINPRLTVRHKAQMTQDRQGVD